MQRAYVSLAGDDFAATPDDALLGALARHLPFAVEAAQRTAWLFEIAHLKAIAAALPKAHFFLEFAIPRMGRRADAVIVHGGLVFVLEYKVGEPSFARHATEQVHGYALDLKNFHRTSHDKAIVPLLIASEAPPQQLGFGFWAKDRVHSPVHLSPGDVLPTIARMTAMGDGEAFDAGLWAAGAYRPTPSIIEAAEALYRGHDVEEIARSEAGENLTHTTSAIEAVVTAMRAQGGKAICFVTGVPGAGKTLAGLNLACGRLARETGEEAVFLSGNGPLVKVLQTALQRDSRRRRQFPTTEARLVAMREPEVFIQNVHRFRDENLDPDRCPPEHVVIFDEAQRAWDVEQTARFMRENGRADIALSEPAFLLSVMDRRPDWCVVVCLIGEGQEINRGEAGIAEWVRALQNGLRHWQVYLPPHLFQRGSGLDPVTQLSLARRVPAPDPALHLAVAVRSFRAESVSRYVGALLDDDRAAARDTMPPGDRFPILRTRDLAQARNWLRRQRRAGERAGLLASSNALRLKPEGIFVKAKVDVCNWFLNDGCDIRASDSLEDAATEFDVQGLELDWTCVAWDLNLRRVGDGWSAREFRGARWQAIHAGNRTPSRADYVRNAYRVLLTRARQGMVIFVPRGDAEDATRPPADYDAIDAWLAACGIPVLHADDPLSSRVAL